MAPKQALQQTGAADPVHPISGTRLAQEQCAPFLPCNWSAPPDAFVRCPLPRSSPPLVPERGT